MLDHTAELASQASTKPLPSDRTEYDLTRRINRTQYDYGRRHRQIPPPIVPSTISPGESIALSTIMDADLDAKTFARWRKRLFRTQADAAQALGLHQETVHYLEKGVRRNGQPVRYSRILALAMAAIANECPPWRAHRTRSLATDAPE